MVVESCHERGLDSSSRCGRCSWATFWAAAGFAAWAWAVRLFAERYPGNGDFPVASLSIFAGFLFFSVVPAHSFVGSSGAFRWARLYFLGCS